MSDTLIIIPARGGSKGIPDKNIKQLGTKPLICYSIDAARHITSDENICVSTDSDRIVKVVEEYGLSIIFKRPAELASDTANSREVLLHAIDHYAERGKTYSTVIMLQPTSPFRTGNHISEAMSLYNLGLDMVVSVKESDVNPYYTLFEETSDGFLQLSKKSSFTARQQCPSVYAYNGAIYIINVNSLKESPMYMFQRIRKYEMNPLISVDIDTNVDWLWAEFLLENKFVAV